MSVISVRRSSRSCIVVVRGQLSVVSCQWSVIRGQFVVSVWQRLASNPLSSLAPGPWNLAPGPWNLLIKQPGDKLVCVEWRQVLQALTGADEAHW